MVDTVRHVDIDPEDVEFNRWMDLLERAPVAVDLPLDMPKAVTWLHVGSSDDGANFEFLRKNLVGVEDTGIRWLSEASGAPAYRAVDGETIRGVRLPFPIGARGAFAVGPGTGIPEDSILTHLSSRSPKWELRS